jgi:hypothetical protein
MLATRANMLKRAMIAQRMLVGGQVRYFGATPETKAGPASGRTSLNPGWYNKRFEPSKGLDGNYFDDNAAIFRGAEGVEPKQTNRDPSKFAYSNDVFRNDMHEWTIRLGDYMWQIGQRIHRSNDGWTRSLLAYTGFCFMMIP